MDGWRQCHNTRHILVPPAEELPSSWRVPILHAFAPCSHTCPTHGRAGPVSSSRCQVTRAGKSHGPWALPGGWGKPPLGVSC